MFLKTLELYGFKSFADRTRIDFSDGTTSLLGPNGSGKSNIVDAIKWVLGEQGVKSLRAEKRDDVIFKGTDHRKPMQMAEVSLVIDNENHCLNIDFPEIEIKRRLYKDGTSEYYINRQQVLLKNIKDLFMDTGVGKTAYSILEQGKIDQILSNKPEERRYVFEEAAGISRYKAQSIDAQKKIEKTDENIEQVNNILKEVKRTYDSRKAQMAKLIEYKELAKAKEATEIELQLSTLQTYRKFQSEKQRQKEEASSKASEMEAQLSDRKKENEEQQRAISEIRDQRNEIMMEIGRLNEAQKGKQAARDIYDKQYWDSKQRCKNAEDRVKKFKDTLDSQTAAFDEIQTKIDDSDSRITDLENSIIELGSSIMKFQDDAKSCQDEISAKQAEIEALRQDRITITSDISSLASEITAELQKLIEDSGYSIVLRKETEKKVIANLSLISKTLGENGRTVLELFLANPSAYRGKLEELYRTIIDYADETKGLFQEYCGTIPTFIDELVKPDGIISKKKELDKKLESNQRAEEDLLGSIALLGEKRDHHLAEVEDCRNQLTDKKTDLGSEKASRQGLQTMFDQLRDQVESRQNEYDESVAQMNEEQDRVNESLASLNSTDAEIEEIKAGISDKRVELSDVNAHLDEENRKLQDQNGNVSELYNELNDLRNKVTSLESDAINLGELINKIYSDFFDQYGKSLKEFDDHEVTSDVGELKKSLAECKQKLAGIPYVNQMADQEFEEVKTRYDFYTTNLADLEKAKADLQEVFEKIKTESEELFMTTFSKISESFKSLFSRIFGGGKAELNLVDPDNPLDSGIDILAQPPGKKLTYLPLLSGGESSMTAVALLFATYAVKPSPFCILDEIDAALDAKNISYFLSVLDDFSDKSQFIIITHNKNTVMGSKSLLGVTQQEQGVSTMISYKLDTQENLDGLNLK
jgi:chromosome segregation protein